VSTLFEARLDWKNQPMKFDYKEELQLHSAGHTDGDEKCFTKFICSYRGLL